MTTLTFPLSRIEGHARVVIEVEGGDVVAAQFQAMEMRGFRHFVLGTPAEQMPVIVTRICGVCSTAHHVASVKALEDVFEVTPPKLAEDIRELLLLGQLIQRIGRDMMREHRQPKHDARRERVSPRRSNPRHQRLLQWSPGGLQCPAVAECRGDQRGGRFVVGELHFLGIPEEFGVGHLHGDYPE